ncbi:MAG: glycosyltransferase family 2 protein [Deltaproteobacteria bacterium]|nr:MAG: glycosyltransferase family 2 protein [Deltaproteobacteria bacterium]
MISGPALDVLICTYERGLAALLVVGQVLPQLGPSDRVIVVDQSRRVQPLRERLAALGDRRVQHVAAPACGLPAARNRALQLASAPLVLFFDDDVTVCPGCLDAHRRALSASGVVGTVGGIQEQGAPWNARRTVNRVGLDGRIRVRLDGEAGVEVRSVRGCNMGFRREVVQAVGGFDVGFAGSSFLEETDLSTRLRRAGGRLRYVPEGGVIHHALASGGVRQVDGWHTARWRFRNTGRYLAKHRGAPGVALALPTFMAIGLAHAVRHRDPRGYALTVELLRGAVRTLRDR